MEPTNEQLADSMIALATKILGSGVPQAPARVDAIDQVLASPPRVSQVADLRDSKEMQDLRTAIVDALIRNDALRNALILVNTLVTRLGVI